ncbi:MAG: ABC transporter ATP-binding protein [Euryarchaeota archaeon]|nr:ABC transporter ATP-binding protein [Euryarchaeota archaeon]
MGTKHLEEARKNSVIETEKLSKYYGHVAAVNKLSIKVGKGTTGLLGPNGAGKSTLIRLLLGLIRPSSGKGAVLTHDIKTEGIMIREKIGYMPEHDCLIENMDGVDFVTCMGIIRGLPRDDALQRAHETLYYAGIKEERYREIKEYSAGLKQRIKLAQALVHDPQVLFLDEPTNGMDPLGRDEMLTIIKDISSKGKDVLLSSHILPDVEKVCENVLLINKGKLVVEGKITDLLEDEGIIEVRVKKDPERLLDGMDCDYEILGNTVKIERYPETIHSDLFKNAIENKIQIRHISNARNSLEELFVSLMGD